MNSHPVQINMLFVIPVRFLSLLAAVDRFLRSWTVIKSWFLRHGEVYVSRAISGFVDYEKSLMNCYRTSTYDSVKH